MIINRELALSLGVAEKDMWATPDHIYNPLYEQYKFTLDPCCTIETAKCHNFFTPADDGLSQDWGGQNVFVNPPYSRKLIPLWVAKCLSESRKRNTLVAALLPVSTSSKWWHLYVVNQCQIRFYKGRIRFDGASQSAPFSSVLCVYHADIIPGIGPSLDAKNLYFRSGAIDEPNKKSVTVPTLVDIAPQIVDTKPMPHSGM